MEMSDFPLSTRIKSDILIKISVLGNEENLQKLINMDHVMQLQLWFFSVTSLETIVSNVLNTKSVGPSILFEAKGPNNIKINIHNKTLLGSDQEI
ncbi:hypothetical protein BpHYR1_023572 [Brachionus plicatilis]|uniref:Uncharacterized protein n=1 Tax=Brachionus plicatilis TaxID=10195 RepID=A0A3M7PFC3_BRAPC|nr:hypothetical protein BpHYR1_023572 [Brachionus plicatilis]